MARGHQSRLASVVTAGSVVTDAQASRSWASTASGTATAGWSRRARTRAGSPASSIGAVGAPGPRSGRGAGR